MKKATFLIVVFLMSIYVVHGQSPNVDCASALELTDIETYCSEPTEFDNEDAGDSGETTPGCWGASQNDLWFYFSATHKSVTIVVNGDKGGTLINPEIALYKGNSCNSLIDINECEINVLSGIDVTTLNYFNLEIGDRYYIRIDGRTNGNSGLFQLCVESYNPPIEPGQDCATASLLCSKEPFVVQNVTGEGLEGNEAAGSCLDVGSNGSENRSVWYKWTCSVSGTFTMDIIPLHIKDDYDFGIFELPNGINSCDKTMIRCGATEGGEGKLCGINTGLDLTSVDLEEDGGCQTGEDGYLRFIDMEAGKSYALLINNFSSSDAGFSLKFDGTAEFEGPQADFDANIIGCGMEIQIEDASIGGISPIISYEWEFGQGATPATETGPGPFSLTYSEGGTKTITLKVTTDLGCQVYITKEVELLACGYLDSLTLELDSIGHIGCGGGSDGYLALMPSLDCEPYEFNIDGGAFQSTPIFENLALGDHSIGIRNIGGMCSKDSIFTIIQAADFTVDAGDDVTITNPLDSVDLNVVTNAMSDITVTWTPNTGIYCPDGTTNCLNPKVSFPIDVIELTYVVSITDANGCTATDEITVSLDLCTGSNLGINIDSVRSVTCSGLGTGYIAVSGIDGFPDYQYSINDQGFTSDPIFDNLTAGSYFIVVRDNGNCEFGTVVDITEVPDFNMDAGNDITLSFPGDPANPIVTTDATGNTQVIWEPSEFVVCADGTTNCLNPTITVTETTDFTVTIVNENGCVKSDVLTVIVPDVCATSNLNVQLDSIRGDYCNGAFGSFISVSGLGGFPDYQYSIDNGSFSDDSIFVNFSTGIHNIIIQDRFNCTENIEVMINSIPGFLVNAGDDVTINGSEPFEQLNGSHGASGDVTVSWSPSNGIMCSDGSQNCINPEINPLVTTTYMMTVFDEFGCSAIDEVRVVVVENTDIYLPNIFSPNDDGVNDIFSLLSDPTIVENIEILVIFDRWGNQVYSGSNLSPTDESSGWDGKVNGVTAEQGVYTWYAKIRYISRTDGDAVTVSGEVTLIR